MRNGDAKRRTIGRTVTAFLPACAFSVVMGRLVHAVHTYQAEGNFDFGPLHLVLLAGLFGLMSLIAFIWGAALLAQWPKPEHDECAASYFERLQRASDGP